MSSSIALWSFSFFALQPEDEMACDITTLQTDACSNGFTKVAQNELQYRAILLQMLCNGIAPSGMSPILGEEGVPILGEGDVPVYFS